MRPEFHAKDRAAWRRWLSRNHARKREVLLVFYRKATGVPCIGYDEAVEEALCFGWIDGIKRRLDDQRYTYRFTPRRPKSRWSETNRRRMKRLLAAGRVEQAGLAAVEAARRAGTWSASRAPVGMPAELTEALKRSARAKRAFADLAPGQRRQWQRWVGEAKREDTRVRRAAKAVAQLAEGSKIPRA